MTTILDQNAERTGPPAPESPEGTQRLQDALYARLDAVAEKANQRTLEGIADLIAQYDRTDTSRVIETVNQRGESVIRTSRPWDSSPARMRLPEQERALRTWDGDIQMVNWLRAVQEGDFAGRMTSDSKLALIYPREYRADTLEGTADASGAFASGTGGVALPRPIENLVAIAISKVAKMWRWARTIDMTSQTVQVPTAAAATAYVQGEATSPLTGGEPTLSHKTLIAYDFIGKMILGRNFLDDEAANVVPTFIQLMGDALAELEDAEFLRLGTGSAPHVTKLAGTAYAEVSSAEFKAQDGVKMVTGLNQRYLTGARWLMNSTVQQLLSNVRDGFGHFFYNSLIDRPMVISDTADASADAGMIGTFLGYPAHVVDLTAGDIYFGNIARNYAIGRRRGITVEASRDFLFDTRRVIWLVTERIAGNNIDNSAGLLCSGITSATSL